MANDINDYFGGPEWIPDHARDEYTNKATGDRITALQAEIERQKIREAKMAADVKRVQDMYAKSPFAAPYPPRPIGAPLPPPGLMGSPLSHTGGLGFLGSTKTPTIWGKDPADLTDEEVLNWLKTANPVVAQRLAQLVKDWTNTIKNLHNENQELKEALDSAQKEVKALKYALNGPEDDGSEPVTPTSFSTYITKAIKASEKKMAEALKDDVYGIADLKESADSLNALAMKHTKKK